MTDSPVPRSGRRYDPNYFRSVGAQWRPRLVAWAAGIAFGAAALALLYQLRVNPDELGIEGWASVETFDGQRLNVWRLAEYPKVYAASVDGRQNEGLWLGNSQLHAINQRSDSDHAAPHFATERLGWPIYALSLPNANLQEHLVVLQWALLHRRPSVLVLPLVYDDLREDGLRQEFRHLSSPELLARLDWSPLGRKLAGELQSLTAEQTDFQGPTRGSSQLAPGHDTPLGFARAALFGEISLQTVTEGALNHGLGAVWNLWAERSGMYATLVIQAKYFRNWVFDITPTTKRPMIAARYERNMQALTEILRVARDAGVPTLVYVVPLRQDIEPPYFLGPYRSWKQRVAEVAAAGGARYVDMDAVVPDDQWGLAPDDELDFMHFRGPGHRILGEKIAHLVAELVNGAARAAESGGEDAAGSGG